MPSLIFAVAAVATLVAGALAEESGTAAADQEGLSGVLFGATVLAAATSLPELSTGLNSVKQGDYKLAFGDIFGRNAFLPVVFLLAVLVSGKAVLPNAHAADIYLTGLGALRTIVYMAGLIFRPAKEHARLGSDSIAVLAPYVVGVVGLVVLPQQSQGDHPAVAGPDQLGSDSGRSGVCPTTRTLLGRGGRYGDPWPPSTGTTTASRTSPAGPVGAGVPARVPGRRGSVATGGL